MGAVVGILGAALIGAALLTLGWIRYDAIIEDIEQDIADKLSRHERIWKRDNEHG